MHNIKNVSHAQARLRYEIGKDNDGNPAYEALHRDPKSVIIKVDISPVRRRMVELLWKDLADKGFVPTTPVDINAAVEYAMAKENNLHAP